MKEELKQYKVEPGPLWSNAWFHGNGYDVAQVVHERKWRPINSWGRDGYDLGSWPLVMIFFHEQEGQYDVAYYVEGDVTLYSCPTKEVRNSIVDEIAFYHWKHEYESWVRGYDTVDQLPPELRGPFSWKRLEEEKEEDAHTRN